MRAGAAFDATTDPIGPTKTADRRREKGIQMKFGKLFIPALLLACAAVSLTHWR